MIQRNIIKLKKLANNHTQTAKYGTRRVVVTGLGLVTPLGSDVNSTWGNLIASKSGISEISSFDTTNLPVKIAATVRRGTGEGEFDVNKYIPKQIKGTISPFIEFAIAAASQAIENSGWKPTKEEDKERTGVTLGSGMGSLDDIINVSNQFNQTGYRKVSPYFIPKILINLAAGHISMLYGFKGPNHAAATACATGAHSIGDAYRMILYGDADVMIAGGSEAAISPLSIAGFARAKALSTKFNDSPTLASRPFDKERDGFVMGEGAGALVLEEYEHAKARNAPIYCEIKGYGLSGDAYHITSPSEDGGGAQRCMKAAIRHAGLQESDVDYVNAHATSTPLGDTVEHHAIKTVFGSHAKNLNVSSTKGATGHLLGAAGAVEAIFTILSIYHNVVPPTINLHNPDEGFDLNLTPLTNQNRKVNVAISNSFGFGGTNASLLFSKVQ